MEVENTDESTHGRKKSPNVSINNDIRVTKLTNRYFGVDSVSDPPYVAHYGVTWPEGLHTWPDELFDRYNES